MAGTLSDYLELELLDHVFGNAAYSAPATIYFGLWTAALTDVSTGAAANEVPNTNGYARQSLTNNLTNFPAASGGAKSNGVAITGWAAAGGNWGTVTHLGCLDSGTYGAGNMLAWCDLTVSKTINNGDTAQIAIGDFDVLLT
ncbi:MAG TPA: hypothetical protein VIH42_05610 [Thermoguttaceae bacterium]